MDNPLVLCINSFVLFCFVVVVVVFGFSRQDSSVALEPVLELALVNQVGLKLTGIHLPLPPECWDRGLYHHRQANNRVLKSSSHQEQWR